MNEQVTPPVVNAGDQNVPPVTPPADGSDPSKNGADSQPQVEPVQDIDFSKLSDKQLEKVLEDKRLWNLPRISEIRDKAKKAKEYEASEAKKAEDEAIKKGEFDKVIQTKDAKIQELESTMKNQAIDLQLTAELTKLGVTNISAALRIIDRANLTINDQGSVEGVAQVVEAFKTEFPELVKKSSPVGSGTNPSDIDPNNGTFTLSQINDPAFYAKNHPAIKKAMATGKIIDDRPQS